ncbi:hypothetical protein GE21DRAFT_6836 [Neurospora crassa]|nr:hypothetical protein GE21DRAFT_6836 [Neurospora crassa]
MFLDVGTGYAVYIRDSADRVYRTEGDASILEALFDLVAGRNDLIHVASPEDPNLLQGACPAKFAACSGLGDGLARARAGAAAVVVGAAAAAAAAHAGSGSGSGGVGHRGAAFAAEVAMLEGLSDSLARSFAKETEQIGDRVEGAGVVLTVEARVFAVVAAAAWAAAALVRLNLVVRVKKEKRKGTRPREERVFYLPPGGMDKCSGKPIVRRNRMKSLCQPAKKIACVSSQLGGPVTHARFEGKNTLEEGTTTAHGQSAPGIQACGD